MPKLKHMKKVYEVTHLTEQEQKILLGMVVLYCLQEKKITLEELQTLQNKMSEELTKKK